MFIHLRVSSSSRSYSFRVVNNLEMSSHTRPNHQYHRHHLAVPAARLERHAGPHTTAVHTPGVASRNSGYNPDQEAVVKIVPTTHDWAMTRDWTARGREERLHGLRAG